MGKVLTLILTILLALGSLTGYIFLTKEIISGNLKIVSGQKQLAEGEQMLAQGKAKLASGKQRLSGAKKIYNNTQVNPLMFVASLPVAAVGVVVDKMASQKIAEGDRLVARGAEKVRAGEKQLAEGKLDLSRGIERLHTASQIRMACAMGAIFFGSLSIVLGVSLRRSLKKKKS